MKRHFVIMNDVMIAYTSCGVHRGALDPKNETKTKRYVTCKRCLKVLEKNKNEKQKSFKS
jgi:hypothetical protein